MSTHVAPELLERIATLEQDNARLIEEKEQHRRNWRTAEGALAAMTKERDEAQETRDALEAELAQAHAALDAEGVARGVVGYSVRYRIGLLGEAHSEELAQERSAREKWRTRLGLKNSDQVVQENNRLTEELAQVTKELAKERACHDCREFREMKEAELTRVTKERDEARLETQGWRDLCNERRRDEVGGAQIRAEQAESALKAAKESAAYWEKEARSYYYWRQRFEAAKERVLELAHWIECELQNGTTARQLLAALQSEKGAK